MPKEQKTPITLRLLAEQLQLHVSTVSRVLNGSAAEAKSAASPEIIAKIQSLAAELQYSPNPHARGLKSKRTYTIGVIVPRLSDLVLATIYEGIDETANKHHFVTFVSNTGDKPDRQQKLGKTALQRRVDGLIFADARLDNHHFLTTLEQTLIPVVLVSRRIPEICSVTCDDFQGGKLAAQHLIEQGHRHIAVLAGEPYASTGIDRLTGFLHYCHQHNITITPDNIIHSPFDTLAGRIVGETLFKRKHPPTAYFAVNDFLAIGLMGAAKDAGLRPGQDIAVMGFNDTPIAAELPISLTTIRSPMHAMGCRAMELLIQKINGESPKSEQLQPTLMVRDSTGSKHILPL